jgi:hypothetical protein
MCGVALLILISTLRYVGRVLEVAGVVTGVDGDLALERAGCFLPLSETLGEPVLLGWKDE